MIQVCKPMMMDCLSCKKRKQTEQGENFCFEKEPCSVPFAYVENGQIIKWL